MAWGRKIVRTDVSDTLADQLAQTIENQWNPPTLWVPPQPLMPPVFEGFWAETEIGRQHATRPRERTVAPPPPLPSRRKALPIDEEFMEYVKLAGEVGFTPPHVNAKRFEAELSELGLEIYNYAEVTKFLNAHANGRNVVWTPLAKYKRDVPIDALRLVKIVQEKIPEVRFSVSDYVAPTPDPFLAVGSGDNQVLAVIYHWDEPDWKPSRQK